MKRRTKSLVIGINYLNTIGIVYKVHQVNAYLLHDSDCNPFWFPESLNEATCHRTGILITRTMGPFKLQLYSPKSSSWIHLRVLLFPTVVPFPWHRGMTFPFIVISKLATVFVSLMKHPKSGWPMDMVCKNEVALSCFLLMNKKSSANRTIAYQEWKYKICQTYDRSKSNVCALLAAASLTLSISWMSSERMFFSISS